MLFVLRYQRVESELHRFNAKSVMLFVLRYQRVECELLRFNAKLDK
jgi:hypothetical protein